MDKPIVNLKKILKANDYLAFAARHSVWPDSLLENQIDQPSKQELEYARNLINAVLVQYD